MGIRKFSALPLFVAVGAIVALSCPARCRAADDQSAADRGKHVFDRFDGKGKVDVTAAPKWWPSGANESQQVLRSLPGVKVFEIGRSAGELPIIAGAWGEREDLPGRTSKSLGSALAGGSASYFYGKGERKRQSFVFVGNAHGLEFEGTVAALNMLSVVATGKDLRGRAWPRLQRSGQQLRIVVIPHLNMDGRMRYSWCRHVIAIDLEAHRHIFFGEWKDGRKVDYSIQGRYFPMPVGEMSSLGGYYNDNGVSLVRDTGLGIEPQPETKALLSLLREEMADCALLSHTDRGSLVQPPDAFIPQRFRQRQAQLSALVGTRCKGEIRHETLPYTGEALYQSDLVYHACGALPVLVEFPCGWQGKPGTFDEILDIGMKVLEEVMSFGVDYRFRPPELKP